ncbi:MAG: hypothetical protein WKF96_20890 [Solirubrobacteraceae bacterium]
MVWRRPTRPRRLPRARQLILLRAHTLTYAPLRRLADITDSSDIHLWLVVHQERVPASIAQLLEGVPHDTGDLNRLLAHVPEHSDDPDAAGHAGAGPDYP